MAHALEISGLSKRYGKKPALQDVSLAVGEGEVFGFLGPNGAGKTTTIRCIMGFIHPNSGTINLLGKNAQTDSIGAKKLIGYQPADTQMLDKWTVRQHLSFYAQIKGHSPHLPVLLKRLDLDPNLEVRHMSTGDKQKLGFVLALVGQPKLLILDEPTRGLDPLIQTEIYAILKEFKDGGGTVFISSHNLAEVEHVRTSVGVIKDGKIVADKSMADIRSMKTHIVTVTLDEKAAATSFKPKNAEITERAGGRIVLKTHGDINPLLAELARHRLLDVEITHAPLEDIFMEYYKD